MKTTSTQEILLLTGTYFSSRHSFEKNENPYHLTDREQLEEACWNGLLKEMLPEICEQDNADKLYMWQVWKTNSFIEIEMAETPEEKDNYYSIDPYSFLPEYIFS